MIGFSLAGEVADVDCTTVGDPHHPAAVLLLELGDAIVRIVLPGAVARRIGARLSLASARRVLHVGRRVRVGGHLAAATANALRVAESIEFLDLQ